MQLSNTILIIAVEIYAALILVMVIFWLYTRRLKALIRRQQEKVVELLNKPAPAPVKPQSATQPVVQPQQVQPPTLTPAQHYKSYINKELEVTAAYFSQLLPAADISTNLPPDAGALPKILAMRYAFLRTEELGTTENPGTEEYWKLFHQALEPFLAPKLSSQPDLNEELATANKRIENLEKFKKLFFDMEKQWGTAQANAQDYYNQLLAISLQVEDSDRFQDILNNYHGSFDDIHRLIINNVENGSAGVENKVINITRHDPRAAEEITKLRNVAADQHRIINQLQRKLIDATTSEEKELVIRELEQQLQRQTRFVQESETCVRLLEEELLRINDELHDHEKVIEEKQALNEENQLIKNALHNFTLESKDLISNINDLEKENEALRHSGDTSAPVITQPAAATTAPESGKIKTELQDLKKQYAELEEKYLELKFSK